MDDAKKSLEFNSVVEELQEYALSEDGRKLLEKMAAFFSKDALETHLNRVQYIQKILKIKDFPRECSFPDIAGNLPLLRKAGYVLEEKNIYDIGRYIFSTKKFIEFILEVPEELDLPRPDFDIVQPDLQKLNNEIFKALESPGIIKMNHPRLKPLINEMDSIKSRRTAVSSDFMKKYQDIWQQSSPTIIDGRIVLPLKNQNKGKVKGFIQGTSSSGHTLYIEPPELAECNNNLIVQNDKIRQEIHKIVKELTQEIKNSLEQIELIVKQTAFLDELYAKARYAHIHQCERPKVEAGIFSLKAARHPMLRDGAVPITVSIPEDKRIVIMTGPNAGGKTVTVKTVGLLTMMLQHGMLIPASEDSSIPLFSNILADIGDDQSISESLSTFSGHMKKISTILRDIDKNGMVILDELGSGTDPVEGGALAQSILQAIIEIGCLTFVTSHHTGLKKFAYIEDKVINASMEYNEKLHVPTYHIIFGKPGNSYAIETAKRVGMPANVIEKAVLNKKQNDDETLAVIQNLEEKELEISRKFSEIKDIETKLQYKEKNLEEKEFSLKEKEQNLRKYEYEKITKFLQEKEDEIKRLNNVLQRQSGEHEAAKVNLKKPLKDLLEEKNAIKNKIEELDNEIADYKKISYFIGMPVFAGKFKQKGVIKSKGKKKGYWNVELGSLRIEIHENNLEPQKKEPAIYRRGENRKKSHPMNAVEYDFDQSSVNASFEIDLRGLYLEEAIKRLERQIDNALLQGIYEFSVIHGKGEGILQKGVHDYLKSSNVVEEFFFAHPEEGGYGKTYIKLQK
ncbi:MAG: Smr/MutS family protein [Spirochaetia bacterium]|nr:Smr/MutS family protein [Spirochaetia bacterium]